MSIITLRDFKDNWETIIVYFKTNSICCNCYYLYLLTYVLLYHVIFYWSKTIRIKDHEGNSHLVDKILSKS